MESKFKDMGETIRVKVTFFEEVLGTAASDPDIYDRFIGANGEKSPEERAAIEEAVDWQGGGEVPCTVFPRVDGEPVIWDYQWKGCFKDACGGLWKVKGTESSKLKAYKKLINKDIFVFPRAIPLMLSGPEGKCQRPLRAQTAQGERVSLASSETVPAGTSCEFSVQCLDPALMPAVREWLDYGELGGFGQWRNSGKGRFTWEQVG